ncbi:BMC domain-containing protein [Clostridium sp. Marseille-Q7071]
MSKSLGLMEFNSIARGIEVADIMFKASNVEVVTLRHICPGKFMIILCGDVEEVKEAIETSKEIVNKNIVASFVIANAHEELINGLKKRPSIDNFDAVGVMETANVTSSLISLDLALKSASIKLVKLVIGNGIGGKSYFVVTGSVSSVEEAIKIAESMVEPKKIIHKTIIPSPSKILLENL